MKEMLRGKKIAGKYLIDVYFHGIECTDIPFTFSKKYSPATQHDMQAYYFIHTCTVGIEQSVC